jgi:uncharacterized RDD family membrane protein YckC
MATQVTNAHANVIEGYKQLGDMLRHEEALFWKRMETFLIVNAGLLGILGLFWPETPSVLGQPQTAQQTYPSELLGITISIVGLIMCLIWLIVVRRSEAFYNLTV